MSTDLFRRRADECRRLAAAAKTSGDRAFWLGLAARWQALEGQNVWERKSRDSPKLQAIDGLRPPAFSDAPSRYRSGKDVVLTVVR